MSSSSVRSRGWLRSIAATASLEEDVLSTIVAPIRPKTISIASSQIGWGPVRPPRARLWLPLYVHSRNRINFENL